MCCIVLCEDASKSTTKPSLRETLKYLDFDLISNLLYILKLVQTAPAVFSFVSDANEKFSIAYNTSFIDTVFEKVEVQKKTNLIKFLPRTISWDEESVKFGLDRVCAAALRRTRFIWHIII